MAELAAPSSCRDARGMWRGPGNHFGKAGRLARKLLEAVYEGKSVEIEVKGRMEACGRANDSWSPGVCAGKGALAAGEGGWPFACPRDVVFPQPFTSVPLSSSRDYIQPSPASGHGALCHPVPPHWGWACHGGTQGWLKTLQAWECRSGHLSSCCQQRPGTQGEKRELAEEEGRLGGKRGRKQLSQGWSCFSFLSACPHVNGWPGNYLWAEPPPRHTPSCW